MADGNLKRNLPAYLEYASDVLANTHYRLMSISEKGLWDLMRKECWVNYSLPSDPAALSKILNMSPEELQCCLTERVLYFFLIEDGQIFSPELENYRASVLLRRELQAKGGSKGGLKTQKTIRDERGHLEGNFKVLNRNEMQREEEKRFSQKESELSEHKKWIEALE